MEQPDFEWPLRRGSTVLCLEKYGGNLLQSQFSQIVWGSLFPGLASSFEREEGNKEV